MKIYILILLPFSNFLFSQEAEKDSISDWDRTFMPAIQIGYVDHANVQLSGGLMVQTSIEYRHKSNLVFRVNYDDFNADLNLDFPINNELSYRGQISFKEFIGGIGYRDVDGIHNFTAYLQGGIRNYGYPIFTSNEEEANIYFDTLNIGILRYSFGYELALAPKLFFTIESLISHTFNSKDL